MKQKNSNRSVRIFSARACAAPLEKAATQFMDFLASPEARQFYKEYGWSVIED